MGEARERERRYQRLAQATDEVLTDSIKDMEAASMGEFGPVLAGAVTALVRRVLANLPPTRIMAPRE